MMNKRLLFAAMSSLVVCTAGAGVLPADRSAGGHVSPFGKTPVTNIIFDQGPGTGTNTGCYANSTSGQNFSDYAAPVTAGTSITGIVVFTCIPPTSGTVTFKAVDQVSHTIIHTESGTPASWTGDETNGYVVTYMLASPYVVPAANVGYGLSGDGIELGQNTVAAPGDSLISVYTGPTYAFDAEVGDQMYQLLGGSPCDLNGDGKVSGADYLAFFKACKASGATDCGKQLIAFVRQCKAG